MGGLQSAKAVLRECPLYCNLFDVMTFWLMPQAVIESGTCEWQLRHKQPMNLPAASHCVSPTRNQKLLPYGRPSWVPQSYCTSKNRNNSMPPKKAAPSLYQVYFARGLSFQRITPIRYKLSKPKKGTRRSPPRPLS